MLCLMQGLISFLKACAVAGGMPMGILLTNWKRAGQLDKMLVATGLFASPAFAHSWYPADCCNGKDCMPASGRKLWATTWAGSSLIVFRRVCFFLTCISR